MKFTRAVLNMEGAHHLNYNLTSSKTVPFNDNEPHILGKAFFSPRY